MSSSLELFSLKPLLSFNSVFNDNNFDNNLGFDIDNPDEFQILSWTAGGRFDEREFIVIACRSCPPKNLTKQQLKNLKKNIKNTYDIRGSYINNNNNNDNNSNNVTQRLLYGNTQQYIIIRSINTLPEKIRSKFKRRSKKKHKQLIKESNNIQHLYGDTYHININDDNNDNNESKLDNDSQKDVYHRKHRLTESNIKRVDTDDTKHEVSSSLGKLNFSLKNNADNSVSVITVEGSDPKNNNNNNVGNSNNNKKLDTIIDDSDDGEYDIETVSSLDSEPPNLPFGKNFGLKNDDINNDGEEYDELPVLRIITWFKTILSHFDKTIISMDFNPSGSWLTVICRDCSVYLLPLRNFLEIPTHQLELSVTTAYQYGNDKPNEFFEQNFGYTQNTDLKRGGIISNNNDSNNINPNSINLKPKKKGKRNNVNNIGSTSLAHLVLHRGRATKSKTKKKSGGLSFLNKVGKFVSNSSSNLRRGEDNSEVLENAVCALGNESFGALHDLTVLTHGIPRKKAKNKSKKSKKSKDLEDIININKSLSKDTIGSHNTSNLPNSPKISISIGNYEYRNVEASCGCWWQTRKKQDYIIYGTNDGRLCLIDVRTHKKIWIDVGDKNLIIKSLELIIDIRSSSILIHCQGNLYYYLLLERPRKRNRDGVNTGLSNAMNQELLLAGLIPQLNNDVDYDLDPTKIKEWDIIINNYNNPDFYPRQLNLSSKTNDDNNIKNNNNNEMNSDITLNVYHNTGSVIADPHQQTPTPSEKAARMLGLPYPRRRIVANTDDDTKKNNNLQYGNDPLKTEHNRSCVHFGVFYNKESKLALHALDEIYQPPRAGFRLDPALHNVFAHNFIISLAPNGIENQISIIAPPLASLMNPIYETDDDDDDDDLKNEEEIIEMNSDDDDDSDTENYSIQSLPNTQDMLSDDNELKTDPNPKTIVNNDDTNDNSNLREINLKRALAKHVTGKAKNSFAKKFAHGGTVQILTLDPDEKVQAILDRTTSVIMKNPYILTRMDPLELKQLNKDGMNAFDQTITPGMGNTGISYAATHSSWNALQSPYLLLLTNKAVYQITKQFDGFATILKSIENNDFRNSSSLINGLATCCEVNSKSIHEIAADRMLSSNTIIKDAERAFELYCRSSVTVAKLVRQFLRPQWLHDPKHNTLVNKISKILQRMLATADIPNRIMLCDIMFNLLLLQYHLYYPFLRDIVNYPYKKPNTNQNNNNNNDSNDNDDDDDSGVSETDSDTSETETDSDDDEKDISNAIQMQKNVNKISEADFQRKKLVHYISVNYECTLKEVVKKLLNISQQELALHVLESHDNPKRLQSMAFFSSKDKSSSTTIERQQNASITGTLSDFFLQMISELGLDVQDDSTEFIISLYPQLFLEKHVDLKGISKKYWIKIIINMLDLVVNLCNSNKFAELFYEKQELFRKRKIAEQEILDDLKIDDDNFDDNKDNRNNSIDKSNLPLNINRHPKSYQEEIRLKHKQLIQYIKEYIDLFDYDQLLKIYKYISSLINDIINKFNKNEDNIDILTWSTPGWLLLNLKILLKLRQLNKENQNLHGKDEYVVEFNVFLDNVLNKFTGMLDVSLIYSEILKYNDLIIATLLHDKIGNYHDYILTYIKFLHTKKDILKENIQYRNQILTKLIEKLLLLSPLNKDKKKKTNIVKDLLYESSELANAQGRCLTKLITLYMKYNLNLFEIESYCIKYFNQFKYGLVNLIFKHWNHYQTDYNHNQMPKFSPNLMLKITTFALKLQNI